MEIKKYFNPRTRVECDSVEQSYLKWFRKFQSTHSCRVRRKFIALVISTSGFQSTHSCRVRQNGDKSVIVFLLFQSTHSCRVRPKQTHIAVLQRYFNPRTRVECDIFRIDDLFFVRSFQSTHSCRVRRDMSAIEFLNLLRFQSTHSRGVRPR